MSMKRSPEARLSSGLYDGPVYPLSLSDLVRAFTPKSPKGLDKAAFDRVARLCTGFQEVRWDVETSDGYTWFAVVWYRVDGSYLAIAFPYAEDTTMRHDTRLDRSPAVYYRKGALTDALEALIEELTRLMAG